MATSPAAWLEGAGAAGALLATSAVFYAEYRRRRRDDRELRFSAALAVTITAGQSGKRVVVSEEPLEATVVPQVGLTVTNGGYRAISDVAITVITLKSGVPIGNGHAAFIQSGGSHLFQFDPDEEGTVWNGIGGMDVVVSMTFVDINGTRWRRVSDPDTLEYLDGNSWRSKP